MPKTLDKICEFMVKYTGCHELRQRKHIDKRIVKAKTTKTNFTQLKVNFGKISQTL